MNRILQHYDLTHLHTFRLPSKAHSIVTIQTPEDVESLPADAYLLGEGSNTLFLMDFARPIALMRLKGIQIKEFSEYWEVRAAAGEHWHELVVSLTEQGVWGLENLRSEEHTSELQSRPHLVCRLLLEKKKGKARYIE